MRRMTEEEDAIATFIGVVGLWGIWAVMAFMFVVAILDTFFDEA